MLTGNRSDKLQNAQFQKSKMKTAMPTIKAMVSSFAKTLKGQFSAVLKFI
jgi:hypothetical protein